MGCAAGLLRNRAHAATLVAAGCGCVVAGGVAAVACFTAPPPNLPELTDPTPIILNDAVQPPEGPLFYWPTEFIVPVRVDIPTEGFSYNVFVDYPVNPGAQFQGAGPLTAPDGGVSLASFILSQPDTPMCPHRIDFIVAAGFDSVSSHTPNPNSGGGDIATWWYYPGGGPGGCPSYDAGDGAFPDAPVDGLLVTPEAGGDP
jgi:hypothetical protein